MKIPTKTMRVLAIIFAVLSITAGIVSIVMDVRDGSRIHIAPFTFSVIIFIVILTRVRRLKV